MARLSGETSNRFGDAANDTGLPDIDEMFEVLAEWERHLAHLDHDLRCDHDRPG